MVACADDSGFDDFWYSDRDDITRSFIRKIIYSYFREAFPEEVAQVIVDASFAEIIRHWREDSSPPLPSDLVSAVQRQSKGTLSPAVITAIFLIWLAAVFLPVVATTLPAKDHSLFQDWIATCAFALALVPIVKAKASKKNR
jgi:hypothetical protein